tara:strand:+ start:357 stop:674 length:318 start_codon:yes stop_codon:yes gene_type:complete
MSSTENLLKATINKLSSRIGGIIVDLTSEIALLKKEIPEKLRDEWELFQKEVYEEAETLEKKTQENKNSDNVGSEDDLINKSAQKQIDGLRAKISDLNNYIESES